jgi:hypothetical protein
MIYVGGGSTTLTTFDPFTGSTALTTFPDSASTQHQHTIFYKSYSLVNV